MSHRTASKKKSPEVTEQVKSAESTRKFQEDKGTAQPLSSPQKAQPQAESVPQVIEELEDLEDEDDLSDPESGDIGGSSTTPVGDDSLKVEEKSGVELSVEYIRDQWLELCDQVMLKNKLVAGSLEKGAPTSLAGNSLTITFDPAEKYQFDSIKRMNGQILICKAIAELWRQNLNVSLEAGEVSDHLKPVKRKTRLERKKEEFNRVIEEVPVWKDMLGRFDLDLLEKPDLPRL
ncbi:hypothetical protein K8I28_14715 [bacterium]|nr:hypothetical protein [bacterium]